MTKLKKIIIVVVSLTLIVLSMVLPSFAYVLKDDYGIYYPKVAGQVEAEMIDTTTKKWVVDHKDQTDELHRKAVEYGYDIFDFTISIAGINENGNYSNSYIMFFGKIQYPRTITTSCPDIGQITVNIDPDAQSVGFEVRSTYSDVLFKFNKLRFVFQVFPSAPSLVEKYQEILSVNANDATVLKRELDQLQLAYNNLQSAYTSISEQLVESNQDNDEMRVQISEYLKMIELQSKIITEKQTEIEQLKETLESNNAIFSLFNGIGSGLYNLISPLLSLSVGGITIGAMLAFVCAILLLYFLVKIMIKALGK